MEGSGSVQIITYLDPGGPKKAGEKETGKDKIHTKHIKDG
jgi:hypothetical protein